MTMINARSTEAIIIFLLSSAVVQGKKCYPIYSLATRYKVGDWVSNTHFDVNVDSMGGRAKQVHAYNYQCRSEASSKLCSSASLAPGQLDGMWKIAWEQENEECHTESVAGHKGSKWYDADEGVPSLF
ncbi:hypothetical protein ACHAW6_001608, partial [Cyclotella cf. meneghiniana]